ncbi:zinc metallopeptidase [Aliikangiella coralliicola]|uniref:Zinc metallopeptidase n=1 Tax=Aliikangiella coralliicola TaxID=2592383 RepID=A0A545UA93_9GAMM|nr:zinc metallopeptidase [Aliikangiella coralliicola]TQV86380.1 zinc metallopeptidase [Aliikangiella coralliicola]
MLFAVVAILLLALILGPNWWVRHVLSKHSEQLDGMPGSGGELARHLLDRFELQQVKLETAEEGGDHYDPQANVVRLSPSYLNGKSLTAVAVAAHEVGHAIQFNRNEPVSFLRKRYLGTAQKVQKLGISLLMALPMVGVLVRIPHLVGLTALIGLATLLSSVFIYAAILPEEWDASFNKALPILKKGNYVPDHYMPAIQQILKACALTYVAAALADILRLWRWLALLRMFR